MKKKIFVNSITCLLCLMPTSLFFGAAISELCIILISLIFLTYSIKFKDWKYYKSKLFIILIVFSIFCITSSLISEFPVNSLSSTLFYFRFYLFILSIWFVLDNQRSFPVFFLYSIVIPLIIGFFYTLYQVFNPALEEMRNSDFRISGFFGDELVQGSYYLRFLILFNAIYYLVYKDLKINKLYFCFLFICIFVILVSGERAALALLILFLILNFIFLKLNIIYKLLTILSVGALISICLFYLPGLKSRIYDNTASSLYDNNQIKFFSRGHQEHYTSAIKMFKENMFIGVGVRNFRLECRKEQYKKIGVNACTTHPHNTYFQFLAETGLIGLTFIMSFLIYISGFLFVNFLNLIKSKEIDRIKVLFGIAIFINIFPLVPTGNFFNNWLSVMYFLPLAFFFYKIKK